KMCEILKDDLSVNSYAIIDTIGINKKREYDDLLDTNNSIKTVKKKKINNDKTGINEIIKQKIEKEREWHKEEKE
ncbi:19926_t:CDS:1, partial [Funneliformis geosporum]